MNGHMKNKCLFLSLMLGTMTSSIWPKDSYQEIRKRNRPGNAKDGSPERDGTNPAQALESSSNIRQ